MRIRSLAAASALALLGALPFAAPAGAAPAQCFDSFGGAIGPSFDTLYPNYHWIQWVQARGGQCRALAPGESGLYTARVLDYPAEYLAVVTPSAPPTEAPVLSSRPPVTATSVWLGDSAHAATLLTMAYADRGRPTSAVVDTGRVIYRPDGVWRIYDVTMSDGYSRQVAVHMRPSREYFVMESGDGENWSAAVYLGR